MPIGVRVVVVTLCIAAWTGITWSAETQDALIRFKENECVMCHSRSQREATLTNRYLDWHMSRHKEAGVGCEACHGGDAKQGDKDMAHAAVRSPDSAESRLNARNISATCGTCHQAVAAAFSRSAHAQKLGQSGMGPTCSTCHTHMASQVVAFPAETTALCAQCHDASGTLPRRPDIGVRAGKVMEAFERANGIVAWADRLVDAAVEKKIAIDTEKASLLVVQSTLSEAKAAWHGFTFEAPERLASEAFRKGTVVKDKLMTRLGFAR
jgi:hypothetical protein